MSDGQKRITYFEHKFIKELYTLHGEEWSRNNYDIKVDNDYFNYLRKVESHLTRVHHTLQTLQLIRVLIAEKSPLSKVVSTSTISKGDFLRYNLENYFLRISTYKDQILLLVDTVLEMNVKRGLGFQSRLEKRAATDNVAFVKLIIENQNIMLKNIKPVRNKIVHEGYHHDSDLGLVEAKEFLRQAQPRNKKVKKKDFDQTLTVFISQNIIEMRRAEEDLATNLFSILDILLLDFEKIVKMKRSKNVS